MDLERLWKLSWAIVCLVVSASLSSATNPTRYFVLDPDLGTGDAQVMSLVDGNTIQASTTVIPLDQNQIGVIPGSELFQSAEISATGPFTMGSGVGGADLPAPEDFAGTAFVVPHFADSHTYYVLSPYADAQVTITVGMSSQTITAPQSTVVAFDAGTDNTVSGLIAADQPILVSHVAHNADGSGRRHAYPVPPAALDLWGVRSSTVLIGALQSGTSISVYASDGTTTSYTLDAGDRQEVLLGTAEPQGQGVALHIVADKPVAAVQADDGDGEEMTGFWDTAHLASHYGLPVDTQYVAVVCPEADTSITLHDGINPPETQVCWGDGLMPGKAYFGSATGGANIGGGAYLESTRSVYILYEAAAANDEHNLMGHTPSPGPSAPILDAVLSPTNDNPHAVTGVGPANNDIRLYVNGDLQTTTASMIDGGFSVRAILQDGVNTIYATAWDGTTESLPSNSLVLEYINNVPRDQSGAIAQDTVWTPGAGAPYVISANLSVANGTELILQPGVELQFANGV